MGLCPEIKVTVMKEEMKKLLAELGFAPKNGTSNIYRKEYPAHDNYGIEVDDNRQKIDYGSKIKASAINFSKAENFVVLECVDRLLTVGYEPERIELEKIYPSGHGHSGRLDILVKDKDEKAYLMIECKTAGEKHQAERRKMIRNGGQLFTYYTMDRDAKYLCLYSSGFRGGVVEYKSEIIATEEEWKRLSTAKEIHMYWNKQFKDSGIFEKGAAPYVVNHPVLTYGRLVELKDSDSGRIFHHIMEILRHNVVSDKPNAFNKLLNLFVCKIVDENKNPDDELKFQWLDSDTDESLQMRLNDLYKEGMWRFLDIKITDYSEDEVKQALQGIEADDSFKQTVLNMFRDTRLKKSPNFAFKEVLDEKSFRANAKIVREIVELLQHYKFRYKQRQPFLGDFFELLLNTSMKQEAGQFFTPVPLVRFILCSLPLKEFISGKIEKNEEEILPSVIDYAAGSGHFLTEYMERMQGIIEELDDSAAAPTVKNRIKTWVDSEKFAWAKDCVYGIELDDRLVKTSKVSAFFNGDGEANIIWANGLDNFEKSREYKGLLKQSNSFDSKNNGQFDILISNPPYSVEAFKTTLPHGKETFALYDCLTDSSSEIECLFVERMKQLLKTGGWAGIILPVTILTNGGIYAKAREIILKFFHIKAIVDLGTGTFMKTTTNTVILFLERKPDFEYKQIETAIDRFFADALDVTVFGIEHAFSTYAAEAYQNLEFADYIGMLQGEAIHHRLYEDYQKEFGADRVKIQEAEKEKLFYFLLTYKQEILVVKTGEKGEKKQFLGYEFRERRGHEGLKWLSGGTKLYNEDNLMDRTKVSSYIYDAFCGKKTEIDQSLEKNVSYLRLSSLFAYDTSHFDRKINLNKQDSMRTNFITKHPVLRLGVLVDFIKGVNYKKEFQTYTETEHVVLTADNVSLECRLEIKKKIFVRSDILLDSNKKLRKNDIFMCFSSGSKKHIGKCALIEEDLDYYAGGFMSILRSKSNDINMKYLFAVLSSSQIQEMFSQYSTGSNINNLSNAIADIDLPVPDLSIQNQIAQEAAIIDAQYQKIRMSYEEYQHKIASVFSKYGIRFKEA